MWFKQGKMKSELFLRHKEYLAIAIPFMLATITQPLLGAMDTAIIGRLEEASYIAGVAIGSTIFSTIYWLFGFLRVSTSAFSAQSLGKQKEKDQYTAYFRPFFMALLISGIFIVLQGLIKQAAITIYNPEPAVILQANTYFDILIWGAPFVLLGYVNIGWLMGRKYARETLILQISMNVLNILLDVLFVLVWDFGVAGVAYGTIIAQIFGFVVGTYIIGRKLELKKFIPYKKEIFDLASFKKMMSVNVDLIIRTICLLVMTNMFVAKGTEFGTVTLAANAVLFQIQYIISYMFDGIANASSVFAGKAMGEKNAKEFKKIFSISNVYTGLLSVVLAAIMLFFGEPILALFTTIEEVVIISQEYVVWLVVFPFVVGVGLVYYGIFTGCTYTAPVRDSMLMSLFIFVGAYYLLIPLYANHGLWFTFILFSLGRSVFLYMYTGKLLRKVFALGSQ